MSGGAPRTVFGGRADSAPGGVPTCSRMGGVLADAPGGLPACGWADSAPGGLPACNRASGVPACGRADGAVSGMPACNRASGVPACVSSGLPACGLPICNRVGGSSADVPTLILFTRVPKAGQAKTRLIPALGEHGAAEFQWRLLARLLEELRHGAEQGLWRLRG